MLGAMPRVGQIGDDSRPQSDPRRADERIAALAAGQYGVVARRQLLALGMHPRAISHRLAAARLHQVHRGVYSVGHRVLGPHGRWLAAVLAGGPGAALSHGAAAALWGIWPSRGSEIDVTVPHATGGRAQPGVRIHRARRLTDPVTTHHRIPVTTPARTILDLAATLERRPLERVLDQAEKTRLTDVASLDAIARAHHGHRGARRLTTALTTHEPGTTVTKSELEERFLALCRQASLPQPRVNDRVAGFEVDFVFGAAGLVVETDGWAYHHTRDQFERDRHRDATLARAGYRTLRFTHRQVTTDPRAVARTVEAALRSSA